MSEIWYFDFEVGISRHISDKADWLQKRFKANIAAKSVRVKGPLDVDVFTNCPNELKLKP